MDEWSAVFSSFPTGDGETGDGGRGGIKSVLKLKFAANDHQKKLLFF